MKEEVSMSIITLRPGTLDDAKQCGEICYSAFRAIAEEHNFPPDFLSPELTITLLSEFIAHPDIYGVIAELDGRVVGSNFVDEFHHCRDRPDYSRSDRAKPRDWTRVNATCLGKGCKAALPGGPIGPSSLP
jgi:hypothetical protein